MYSKCKLWLRLVAFLNDIISSEGVEVDPRKVEAVKSCLRPLTPTYIRCLLGQAVCYRRFANGFASIASSLTILTQKRKNFEWSEACERSF